MPGPETLLTPRQLELVALYANGYEFKEIGSIKFLSPHTVKKTLANAKERAGARNLPNLVAICLDAGLIHRNGTGFKPIQEDRIVGE